MAFLKNASTKPLILRLHKELTRSIKRGHPWVFGDALAERPKAPPGVPALLLDKKGKELARGFYDAKSPLAFRVCTLEGERSDETWARRRLEAALRLRSALFTGGETTAYRLLNGEGDGLPGLVCDVYGDAAVLQLDGEGPAGFWDTEGIAAWLADALRVKWVYERRRDVKGRTLLGAERTAPIAFLENGVRFTADLIHGQKTGFFLDQRENRRRIRALSKGRRVLNVFGYTGGFSVYAGLGGAKEVWTVDLAKPALEFADKHWTLNGLDPARHHAIADDAWAFLDEAALRKERWDLVILDPPSMASSERAVPKAIAAYEKLIAAGCRVTAEGGLLAAASCSSHVNEQAFLAACEEGLSQARRRAVVLAVHGQPADNAFPLACQELRYLKCIFMSFSS